MSETKIDYIVWDNDIRKYIGKRIAEMRKEAGLSQVELAEKSGVGDSHIARIEMGRYSVGIDTLQKIADVFGKRVDFVDCKFNRLSEKDMNEIKTEIYTNTPTPNIKYTASEFPNHLIYERKLLHISGISGWFMKEYQPTGKPLTTMIYCKGGKSFFAPSSEFKEIVSQNSHESP